MAKCSRKNPYFTLGLITKISFIFMLTFTCTIALPMKNIREVTNWKKGVNGRLICQTKSCMNTALALLSSAVHQVDPCDNFYEYTCGNWRNAHPLPSKFNRWTQDSIIDRKIRNQVKDILASPVTLHDIEALQKAKLSYQICMNEEKAEDTGLMAIKLMLNKTGGWPLSLPDRYLEGSSSWQYINNIYLRMINLETIFTVRVFSELTETRRNVIWVQPPIQFPIPIAKLAKLENDIKLMRIYAKYILSAVNAMQDHSINSRPIIESIRDMITFEIRLANISMIIPEQAKNELMTINQFQKFYDSAHPKTRSAEINWLSVIREVFTEHPEIIINGSEKIRIADPKYFSRLIQLLDETPEEVVVNYIQWRIMEKFLVHTTRDMRNNYYEFLHQLDKQNSYQNRDWFCVAQVGFEHAVGYAYVKKYFDDSSKKETKILMNRIKEVMADEINKSPWLDNNTRLWAKQKLDHMMDLIGYPDWYNETELNNYYKNVHISSTYIINVLQYWIFVEQQNRMKLRVQTDRKQWHVAPTTTNAFYNIPINAVIIPAAILQAPFFHVELPEAVNYGSIGAIIGHEISHGFDDVGRKYDKDGNPIQWLSRAVNEQYQKKTECFVEQSSNHNIDETSKETMFTDGRKLLRESIADTIGFQLAYAAYKRWEQEVPHQDFTLPAHEQYSNDQLFFLSLANTWCSAESDFYLKNLTVLSKYSSSSQRVNGALSNMQSFSKAFGCPAGAKMNPLRKCNIWN